MLRGNIVCIELTRVLYITYENIHNVGRTHNGFDFDLVMPELDRYYIELFSRAYFQSTRCFLYGKFFPDNDWVSFAFLGHLAVSLRIICRVIYVPFTLYNIEHLYFIQWHVSVYPKGEY